MLYRVTYLTATGEVTYMEEATTTTIEVEDGEIYTRWMNGEIRARVVDGELVEDTSEVNVEENIVPDAALAEALGIEEGVGVARAEIEQLANDAGVTLTDDGTGIAA